MPFDAPASDDRPPAELFGLPKAPNRNAAETTGSFKNKGAQMAESSISAEITETRDKRSVSTRLLPWVPVGAALVYPWALRLFHEAIISGHQTVLPAVWLTLAFALPLSCLLFALRHAGRACDPLLLRVAFAAVAAPPLFVLAGVVTSLLHSPIRDIWIWSALWLALGIGATVASSGSQPRPVGVMMGRLRVLHGVCALLILAFVAFHLTNHMTGLFGPVVHARVMAIGRVVYRSRLVEPALVAILLFQVSSGVRLAWQWSARPLDAAKVMQVGSGAYLAAFILTHLNSALVSARWVHKTPSDWAWATGAPEGLLMDAWNIRLLPHYAFGVFFVIAHAFCGLRVVLLAHGVRSSTADRLCAFGLVGAGGISLLITAALCGLRV